MATPSASAESFLSSVRIKGLWGYRDLEISLTDDTNILIGQNATGKTSIINIVQYLLTLDLKSLLEITFDEVAIGLREIASGDEHELRATIGKEKLVLSLGSDKVDIPLPASLRDPNIPPFASEYTMRDVDLYYRRRAFAQADAKLRERLHAMVPAVWLPVNRGLTFRDEEYPRNERKRVIATVEERLEMLLSELKNYRLALDAKLASNYKEFEKNVLGLILYNKDYDNIGSLKFEAISTQEEQEQLRRAFFDAGLMDRVMHTRIEEHFAKQSDALKRIKSEVTTKLSEKKGTFTMSNFNDIFIAPLIRRTKEMVRHANQVDVEKQRIFAPLKHYVKLVGEFLADKQISVTDEGLLNIKFKNPKARDLTHRHLSSGEKQILILLTQALVHEGRPVVYVADEPELSLHVSWQEKLLDSLRSLNPKMQLILATHSPDIVGKRKVIDLELAFKEYDRR